MMRGFHIFLLATAVALAPLAVAAATETVVVVVGAHAPELEKLAARELVTQWERLFDVEMKLADEPPHRPPKKGVPTVFVGSPQTNRSIRELHGDRWPDVSDQGIVLRSLGDAGDRELLVGGGSGVATLWAVYELGHHLGIRYLLHEDIYPAVPLPLDVGQIDVVREPGLKKRVWRTVNDSPIGPESWPLADHQRLLQQLAKLKFNRVLLSVYPWQPFVDYEWGGVKKETATLWFGEKYPIPRDAPGRTALGGATFFENPDFAGKKTYQEMTEAGTRHLRGIIAEAHRLGMSVGISISPLEFPREFGKALSGTRQSRGLNNLLVALGTRQPWNDAQLKDLVVTKIRAYLATYRDIDAIYLTLPEFPEWEAEAPAAWKHLVGPIEQPPRFGDLLRAAREQSLVARGVRGERSLKGNVVALAFLRELLADQTLLNRPDGQRVELVITAIDPELYPYLEQILPSGAATLNFVDYTARRVVQNAEYLSAIPAERVPSNLIMTLADDNVGILSQSTSRRLETLVRLLRHHQWEGFSTRYWMLAELDPAIQFLSRAAWEPDLDLRSDHDRLFTTITGKQAVADRL